MSEASSSAASSNAPAMARLLDVTRLARRVGRPVLTGIDRVEKLWLDHLLTRPDPLWLLMGRGRRQVLLPREAGPVLLGWLVEPPQPEGLVERLIARRHGPAGIARHRLARLALAGAAAGRIAPAVARAMPQGGWYLNLGHLNAEAPRLAALGRVPRLKRAVFLHDTIPLDHPEWSEPHAVTQLSTLIAAANRHAERVIANSAATRDALHRHGLTRPVRVALLGIEDIAPDPTALPSALDPARSYFVALGTIEPRKDHELLLDLWDSLRGDPPPGGLPQLLIAGRRGWQGAGVLARLDAAAGDPSRGVIETGDLSDAGVAAALQGAVALLMPSRAEGFGLPVFEAARLGCPVIAAPLPVYDEIPTASVVYAPAGDLYAWRSRVIEAMAQKATEGPGQPRAPQPVPGWPEHFNTVLACLT